MIPQSFIQDLLARVDIVDVIDQHLTLKKGGANYFACCPFHGEKSASFSVSPSKQFYHCFGCGVHGNAIGFLMEYSGLSFVEAVRELASRVGMQIPEEQRGADQVAAARQDHAALHEVLSRAALFYREQLKQHPAAIEYLKRRGLSGEIAARFGIGYAPDDWQALRHCFSGYDDKSLLDVGLVIENDQGRRYDRFRDRIMFPIHDRRGRVIGFGGRILDSGEPKYLNSPETPLFEKGRELYGLHLAQKAIRDDGFAVVVEGYMDVVALAQFGIGNAVAALGTATTAHHLHSLIRHTDRIVFCFDGDNAGRKAAWRALEAALEALRDDITLAFLFLPSEHDPDSFVRAQGPQAFREAAAQAVPLGRYLLDTLCARHDLDSVEGRTHLVHDARPLITRITAPVMRLQLLKALADTSGLTQRELEQAYELKPSSPRAQHPERTPPPVRASSAVQRRRRAITPSGTLLRLIMEHPAWAARLPVDLITHDDPESLALVAIIDAMSIGDLDAHCGLGALVERFRETPHGVTLSKVAAELIESEFDEDIVELLFEDALRKLQQDLIDQEIQSLTRKQRESGLDASDKHLLVQLLTQKRKLMDVRNQ